MPEIFKRRIFKLLKHRDYSGLKLPQLAKALQISPADYTRFKSVLEEMHQAGHLVIGIDQLVTLAPMAGEITGTFRANPKGFGFVVPLAAHQHSDLFIPPDKTAGAMTGDIVVAKVVKKGKRRGQMLYSGKVVEISQRAQNRFVGTLLKKAQGWIVQPDGTGFVEPVSVDDVGAKGAAWNDKVVVEILSYPTEKYPGRGVIVEVLGKTGRYETEINSIIHQHHLPEEFEESCLTQARRAGAQFDPDSDKAREDITDKVIITIDPAEAKDFDDAISLEPDSDGNTILGVHIADVSCFVPSDSALDIEARNRGNSVYLPGKTIPMLPEVLSNGICSLQPDQKRFCKSAYITYDNKGNVTNRRFASSVIQSTKRLTYTQANRILKGHTKVASGEVVKLLKNMEKLSRLIESRRISNGTIHLDLPEIELVMDKAGRVVDAHPADTSYPHTIIEMFMVEANEAVAGLLDRLAVGFIRRIHPEPDSLTLKNLSQLVRRFGLKLPKAPDHAAIQQLLAAVKDTDCSIAVNLAVLRSFEKAQYSPLHIGHYALASNLYCHFTSPIRRYADLTVHRILDYYLRNRLDTMDQRQDLTETGKHISFTEQRAEDAERELKTVLILQMLNKHVGDELDCVVTGVTNFGVFAQSRKFGIEGLIRLEDLGPDEWKFIPKTQCLVGLRTGFGIGLGMAVKVRIVSVNVPARQLNIAPVEPLVDKARLKKKTKTQNRRQKRRTSRQSKKRR